MLNGLVPINQSFGSCSFVIGRFSLLLFKARNYGAAGIFGNGLVWKKYFFFPSKLSFRDKKKRKRERESITGKFVNSCAIPF